MADMNPKTGFEPEAKSLFPDAGRVLQSGAGRSANSTLGQRME